MDGAEKGKEKNKELFVIIKPSLISLLASADLQSALLNRGSATVDLYAVVNSSGRNYTFDIYCIISNAIDYSHFFIINSPNVEPKFCE